MEVVSYAGWANCIRLANEEIELVVTTDVGPRIIRLGLIGGPNMFKEFPAHVGKTGGDAWRCYGGHRLWHAPENQPRTYSPDNSPVAHEWKNGVLRLVQPVEATTGIRKEIELSLVPGRNAVRVRHRLVNTGCWDIELAVWALSVMAPGGFAVIPQEPFVPHPTALLPARPLVLWPYTRMNDPRFVWGESYIQMHHRPDMQSTKFGVRNARGWAAFVLGGNAFVKRAALIPGASYPDFDVNFEFYTNPDMLEVETLSPLTRLAAGGGVVEHDETWHLLRVDRMRDEKDFDRLAALTSGI